MKRKSGSTAARRTLIVALTAGLGALACDTSVTGPDAGSLLGTWRLTALQQSPGPAVPITDPSLFTATFGADGKVNVKADCNVCNGSYTAQGQQIEIGPMACTLAYCQSAPLDTRYTELLQSATTWSVQGVVLELRSSQGLLLYRR
jgi:heat shock protein HslJ